MFPDLLFKHNGTNIMSAALVLVHSMGGADEEVLSFFKVVSGGVIWLLLTVVAEHKTGEHIALRSAKHTQYAREITVKLGMKAVSAGLGIRMGYVYLALTVTMAFMVFFLIYNIADDIKIMRGAEKEAAK